MTGTAETRAHWMRDLFLSAAFFALIAGVAEAAVGIARSHLMRRIMWISDDAIWMSPIAYLAFFLAAALLVALVVAIVRRRPNLATCAGIFGGLMIWAWLLPFTQLAWWASIPLAAGMGVQVGRLAGRRPDAWRRRLAVGTAALGALVAVLAIVMTPLRSAAERRALAGLPEASADRPSILLIVLDTVRRANLSAYGYARATTPRLARLAAEGVAFDHAMAAAPWTLPSHGSLFSGLAASAIGGDWRHPVSAEPPMLAELLRADGYATAGFVANLLYTSRESGLARGFVHYDDYPRSLHQLLLSASFGRTGVATKLFEARSARNVLTALRRFDLGPSRAVADVVRPGTEITDAFLAWQGRNASRPFFAFLNYFDAHGPYRAPPAYRTRFAAAPKAIDRYDAAIAFLDDEVGRLLDTLAGRGALDNTIVVVTADHGELFGEHGLDGHSNSLYLPLLEVPLVMRYPRALPAGRRVARVVSLRDVAATLLDVASAHGGSGLPGASLRPFWTGDSAASRVAVAELEKGINVDSTHHNSQGPMAARIDDSLHYIRNGWGREELYAWRADTAEARNLAADSASSDVLRRLRVQLPPPVQRR